MGARLVLFLIVTCGLCLAAWAGESADKSADKSKIEEILLWKVSEDLKLKPAEEESFAKLYRDLSRQRRVAAVRVESLLPQIAKRQSELIAGSLRDDAPLERLLSQYRDALSAYQGVNILEFDQLKKNLGGRRFARYLTLKAEIADRLKQLLSKPEATPPIKTVPKVIEEK